jgi:hypothetical protein
VGCTTTYASLSLVPCPRVDSSFHMHFLIRLQVQGQVSTFSLACMDLVPTTWTASASRPCPAPSAISAATPSVYRSLRPFHFVPSPDSTAPYHARDNARVDFEGSPVASFLCFFRDLWYRCCA